MSTRVAAAGALALALVGGPAAEARRPDAAFANRCVTLAGGGKGGWVTASSADRYVATGGSRGAAMRFFLKPTRLRRHLLHDGDGRLAAVGEGGSVGRADAPSTAAEWTLLRRARGRVAIRSRETSRLLAVARRSRELTTARPRAAGPRTRFRIRRARGCRRFPEAAVGARGRAFRGTRGDGSLIGVAEPHVHLTAELRGGGLVIAGTSFDRFGIPVALGRDADVHGPDGSLDVTGNLLRTGSPAGTHDTEGWPSFSGWPTYDTYTHQQVYYRWLQRAWMGGLRIVVAQAVEDEPLCEIEPRRSHSCDEMDTIELEVRRLRALERYVDAQSGGRGRGWFRLVYDPRAARRVIARGKLAVLIGAESSHPFGCSQVRGQPNCDRAAIDRGIARMRRIGVRSIFVAHWVDNALSGAALEGGDKGQFIAAMQVSQTGEPFQTGPCPHPGQGEEVGPEPLAPLSGGPKCNTKGLTELGEYAVGRLMDAGMLIEVDHLSEVARNQVLAIAERRGYPLVSSHTHSGGKWHESELERLYGVGGIASATLDEAGALAAKVERFRRYGGGVALASDTGGFAALPAPVTGQPPLAYPFRSYVPGVRFRRQRTGERTFDLNTDGMAHYGLWPDHLANVRRQEGGAEALDVLFHSADAYVRMWRRAVRRSR